MTLATTRKQAPDSTSKAKRAGARDAPPNPQRTRGSFPVPFIQRKPTCACGGGCPRCKEHSAQKGLEIGQLQDGYEREADHVAEQMIRMPEPQLQRACANHTMAGGECSECGKKDRFGLQTKFKVNEPGDIYEQEADRIAAQVMSTPVNSTVSGAPPRVPRSSGQSNGQMDAAPASVDQALTSPGRPLEPALRQDMEQRFGHNFSQVRVHSGAAAEQSARDVNAHAYTVGHDIVFGAGRFAPGTHEGRRLIAHELTHVRQQSTGQITGVVQRQPNKDDWSTFESTFAGEPRFVFWAKLNGKPPANHGEELRLLDEYKKAMKMNPKRVLEDYDRAQLERDRSELEKRRLAARAAEDRAAEAKPGFRQMERERARQQNRNQLYTAIQKAWSERRRYADAELLNQAKSIVAHRVPLPEALLHGLHWKSDQQRWVFIYYYYREYSILHPESSADENELLQYAVLAEENYLETSAKEAEAAELAQHRKGIPRAARTEQIKKLAATRPMNPLEDFEPGIHDYAPYQGQPQSADVDIVSGDFDADNLTIKYSDGKKLDIPLGKNVLFPNKPLDPNKVLRIFTRRHKKSQRLIPFVIYENTLGVDLDVLSEEDLALMGLPRFDPVLTPYIMYFLSPEFKMHKATLGALQVASLHAAGLGFRQLGVPLASSVLGTGGTLVTGAARLGTAAARQVSFAVNTYGYSSVAATYLGRTAFTYYRINAVQVNTLGLMGTDIAINLGGGDTGPISPGDQVSMVVADVKAVAKGAKNYWKLIEGEVQPKVNLASKEAIVRITNVGDIAEKTAKAEYDHGKKLALIRQPAGKQPIKPVADPAKVGAPDPVAKDPAPASHQATDIEQAEQRYEQLRKEASQAEDYAKRLRPKVRAKERRGEVPTQQETDLLKTKRSLEKARDDAKAELEQLRQKRRAGQPQEGIRQPGQEGLAQEPIYVGELGARGLSAQLTDPNMPVIDAAIIGTPELHSVKSIVSGTDAAVRLAERGSPRHLADLVSAKIAEALSDRRSDKWSRLRNQWNRTKRKTYADHFGYELPENRDDINFVVNVRVVGTNAPSSKAQQTVEAAVTSWLKKHQRLPPRFSWQIVYVGAQPTTGTTAVVEKASIK
jgi:Domain of unknown function (DUF4157)